MKHSIGIFLAIMVLLLPSLALGQEGMPTPSQKTKEAVDKFKNFPAGARKDISTLKESARSKLKSLGGPRSAAVKEDPLAMPQSKSE
ncbi:MAG: hypothetical protein GTO40_01775, partial [Deltaproteobacteria bacterium]|nr:hypothetical protein [Deltaproteobacteria bacterium]